MAFEYGFYNSINGDRKYNALDFSKIFDGVITDGVFADIGDKMFVTRGAGSFEILVGTGKAWFDHTWNINTSPMLFTLSGSHPVLTRYDAVVLEVNEIPDVYGRVNEIKIIEGIPSSNPVKPTLTNMENIHQHALAYIKINPEATEIVAQDIEIVVGQTGCPFVTSILQQTDITGLFANWNGQFNAWFDNLKAQLTDNVVTNLQNQIDNCLKVTDIATPEDIANDENNKIITVGTLKTEGSKMVYKVGDIVKTYQKGLGANWALCNGANFDRTEYPELANLMPDIKDKFLSPYNTLIPFANFPEENGTNIISNLPSNNTLVYTLSNLVATPNHKLFCICGDKYIIVCTEAAVRYTSGSTNVNTQNTCLLAINRLTGEQKRSVFDTKHGLNTNDLYANIGIYIKERQEFVIAIGSTLITVKDSDIDNSVTPFTFISSIFTLQSGLVNFTPYHFDLTYKNGYLYYLIGNRNDYYNISYTVIKINLDTKYGQVVRVIDKTAATPSGFTNTFYLQDGAWFFEDKIICLAKNTKNSDYNPTGTPPYDYYYYVIVSYLYDIAQPDYYPIRITNYTVSNAYYSKLYKIGNKLFGYFTVGRNNTASRYNVHMMDTLPTSGITLEGKDSIYTFFNERDIITDYAIIGSDVYTYGPNSSTICSIPLSKIDSNAVVQRAFITPTDYSRNYASLIYGNRTEKIYANINNNDNANGSVLIYDEEKEELIIYGVALSIDSQIKYGIYRVSKYAVPSILDGIYSYIKIKDG